MRLESVRIALRPRTAWEAVDLGLRLVRENARAIWVPWLIASLPPLVVLNALAWWSGHPWLAFIAMWWLKPVFGRIPLYVLSRAVFAAPPDRRDTLRAFVREGWRPLWPVLLWRRLDPFRSLHLPIDQLEGMDRKQRSQRRRVLRRAASGQALALTVVLSLFVLALFTSAWLLRLLCIPGDSLGDIMAVLQAMGTSLGKVFTGQIADWVLILTNVLWWLAETVIEPFYIGGGFGLYLNRRIHIEAWDLELRFRNLATRLRESASVAAVVLTLLLPIALAVLTPTSVLAATPASSAATAPTPAATNKDEDEVDKPAAPTTLRAVFASEHRADAEKFGRAVDDAFHEPALGERKTIRQWRLKNWSKSKSQESPPPEWLKHVAQVISLIGEYGLWVLAGLLLLVVLYNLRRWLPWVEDRIARRLPTAIEEHPLAVVTPLPDDVPQAVRALWQTGRRREALALLYRACVAGLAIRLGTPLPPGTTEAQCLRRARALADAEGEQGLRDIVRAWQLAAYAGRWPDDAALESLLSGWSQHFSVRA